MNKNNNMQTKKSPMINVKMSYIISDDIELLCQMLDEMKEGFNYLYTNCVCKIRIDDQTIKAANLNIALYNSESNTLIIFPQGGKISKEILEKMLEERNMLYSEIVFYKQLKENDISNLPEIYYCHNEDNLANRLDNAINQGKTECQYYTHLPSVLSIGYLNIKGRMETMFKMETYSLIKMGNDMMLLISDQYDKDSTQISKELGVHKELKRRGIEYKTIQGTQKNKRPFTYTRKPQHFI